MQMQIYLGVTNTLLSIMTITLNIFVIKFYWRRELTIVPLFYNLIALLDIISGIASIYFYGAILLCRIGLIDIGAFNVHVMVVTFLGQISNRCSVFCNLVLAVSRTIMILKPFYQINIKVAKLSCILYVVPWMILYGLNVHQFSSNYGDIIYQYGFLMGAGLASITETEKMFYIVWILPDFLAFIIPVIIVIVTCIIQMRTLHRSNQFPATSNQRHVTITVLLMSTLFVFCNSPLSAYMTAILAGNPYNSSQFYALTVIFATLLPMLNGAFNPVIIITRSNAMRTKFSDSLRRMLQWVQLTQQ